MSGMTEVVVPAASSIQIQSSTEAAASAAAPSQFYQPHKLSMRGTLDCLIERNVKLSAANSGQTHSR